jgi:hypothetical protein
MGLLFQMPVEQSDLDDRIQTKKDALQIRSYGLPMVFWGYLFAIFSVLFFMILAIKDPLIKAFHGEDQINRYLSLLVGSLLTLSPLSLLALYFYEKEIIKSPSQLILKHKVFFIPLFTRKIKVEGPENIFIEHFLDSPNIAATKQDPSLKGFENRGYHKLMVKDSMGGKSYLIDRNSRRGEMKKLMNLLQTH